MLSLIRFLSTKYRITMFMFKHKSADEIHLGLVGSKKCLGDRPGVSCRRFQRVVCRGKRVMASISAATPADRRASVSYTHPTPAMKMKCLSRAVTPSYIQNRFSAWERHVCFSCVTPFTTFYKHKLVYHLTSLRHHKH